MDREGSKGVGVPPNSSAASQPKGCVNFVKIPKVWAFLRAPNDVIFCRWNSALMDFERRSPHQIHISRIYFIGRRIESLSNGRAPHRPSAASLLRTEAVHAHEWKRN
jgi:hypothetical protein